MYPHSLATFTISSTYKDNIPTMQSGTDPAFYEDSNIKWRGVTGGQEPGGKCTAGWTREGGKPLVFLHTVYLWGAPGELNFPIYVLQVPAPSVVVSASLCFFYRVLKS